MLDLRAIREDPEPFRAGLARRGAAGEVDRLLELDREQRALKVQVEELRAEQNRMSKEIGAASEDERATLIDSLREVSERLKDLEPLLQSVTDDLEGLLARLPNLPHPSVPDGESDEDNMVERVVGDPPSFGFEAKDHL